MQKRKLRTFLEKLIRDPLLFIQLIAITILVIGLANPYFIGSARYSHTIIVLDASASMAATDVSPDRFTQAIDIAREYAAGSGKTTIIMALDQPVLFFQEADNQKAMNEISQLRPKATGTNLNDAMLLAAELMGNEEGKLVVISDFSGQDITWARKTIEAKNIPVDYRQVGADSNNLGIVEAAIIGNDLRFIVKNYNNVPETVRVNVNHENNSEFTERTIKQNSRDFFLVPGMNAGTTRVVLEPQDDLDIDNILYVSMPGTESRKVLLLSDPVDKRSPVNVAFNSIPGLEVNEVSFERAPRKMDYGLVVVYNYNENSLLPGTTQDMWEYVEEGGTLVIVAGSDLQFMDMKKLIPVDVSGEAGPSRYDVRKTELTDGIDFGTSGFLKGTIKEGGVELASAEDGPILSYWNIGKGKVVYLGTNDKWGDFHLQTSYPVFWYKLLEFANPASDELNFRTGNLVPPDFKIHGPDPGWRLPDKLYPVETGFYEINNKTIALNLLDEKESDISVNEIHFKEQAEVSATETRKIHLKAVFSFLAIMLIGLELYYLRYRGDI